MEVLEKAAEILVECGYADQIAGIDEPFNAGQLFLGIAYQTEPVGEIDFRQELLDPFADTLEGRRQADAIEDYLQSEMVSDGVTIWEVSHDNVDFKFSEHDRRLDRIKWCLQELANDS